MQEDRWIDIDVDYKSFEEQLADHKNKMPSIAKKMMAKVNNEVKKQARKEMRSRGYDTSKPEGVYKNLFSVATKKFVGYVGFKRQEGFVYYAPFIKYGAHIVPKNGEFLTFYSNGSWHKLREVTLQPNPFMGDIVRNVWNSGTADKLMNEIFQKELDKIYRKK